MEIISNWVLVALIGFVAFQQWLRHHRRLMVHRERLAALEKGVELPVLEQEIQRSSWNVQRLLLFGGLVWTSLGIGAFVLFSALSGQVVPIPWEATGTTARIPEGLQWIGVAPVGIGLSHLTVYALGKRKEG
jgi:hypothetical protein